MQPLGVIPAPGRPGHIRRRTAGGTGPRRGRPTEYTLRVPGGRRTDRSGCQPPPGRGRPAGHCPGQLVQHLAGEGIGAVRRSNIRTSGRVLLRPAAGASAFGEPAAPAGRQNGQAEQKHSGQTGGQQPGRPPNSRTGQLTMSHSTPSLNRYGSGGPRRRLSFLSDASEGEKVPLW